MPDAEDLQPADASFAPLDQQEDETDLLVGGEKLRFDAAISSTDWTTETVISQLKKGNIWLDPEFQRRDAWSIARKSQYIESLILGIPTPQIILAERKEKRGSYIVIDGKQRLLSLRQFAASEGDSEFKSFKLKGLTARSDLLNMSYTEITGGLFQEHAPDFENATIRTVVIKSWPNEEFLYEVFLRINSGSVQLSPQELRQALHPGPFTTALNRFAIENETLRSLLGLKQPDFRMRDNELILRYIAFKHFVHRYRGNLKIFLDECTEYFNFNWSSAKEDFHKDIADFEYTVSVANNIFGDNAYKKWNGFYFESRINRAVFDVVAYFFNDKRISQIAMEKKEEVLAGFKSLCRGQAFSRAVSGTTKSLESVNDRFELWAETLTDIVGFEVESPIDGAF